jgi:hypothetical protein
VYSSSEASQLTPPSQGGACADGGTIISVWSVLLLIVLASDHTLLHTTPPTCRYSSVGRILISNDSSSPTSPRFCADAPLLNAHISGDGGFVRCSLHW